MANDNKAVGPLASARLVTLIKAETAKKYDKTGGKIEGSAEITGGLKVGMSSEFSSSIKAGSEISSDVLLMAPTVALYDPAKEESISFGVSGENAAKVTSPVSGGGTQYARLAVGTPTGDNDAATKAYVDAASGATVYVDFWPTSSDVEYIETFKAYVADLAASQTFDSVFDLVNTGNTVVARLYDNSNKANLVAESIETGISGDKELGNINFLFMNAATGTPFGLPTISDAIWLTKTNNNTVAYALYRYCPLPLPASDNSDTGKVPTINGKKWELKKPESTTTVDDAMSSTSTNPVQNKVIKQYVDEKGVNYFDTYVEKPTKEKLTAYAYYYTCECKATHTYAEIAAALAKDMVPRVLLVEVIGSVGADRIICPLNEHYNGADGSYDFDAPNIAGMYGYGTGIVSISEDGAVYACSAGELPPATDKDNGKCLVVDGGRYRCGTPAAATQSTPGYMSAADKVKLDGIDAGANKTVVDAALDATSINPVQNKAVKTALDGKAGTAVATASANGLMSAADKTKLDGVEAGANKTTVDAALDAGSANPVQNKVVKAALDSKLSTLGGEISGNLEVGLTVGAGWSVSTGVTRSDSGIHFEKAASDAGRISHGMAGVDDTVPLARLKVASPTEDDDAATKAYVDNNAAGAGAVRYDASQTLTFEQKKQARKNIEAADSVWPTITGGVSLCPEHITDSNFAAHVTTTIASGNDYTVTFDGGPENVLVRVDGIRTPTDTDTNAAANVEYVKTKISEVSASGGVTVDTAMSDTSTNPVQNKTIKQYVDDHAVSLPLTLTYANGQATGASYSEIRKAIESGRQIKLAVANTIDIIASNARNETNKSVLKFVNTGVGGDTVSISKYTVTAQASGLTCNVKSHELA